MFVFATLVSCSALVLAATSIASEDTQTPLQVPSPKHRSVDCKSEEWLGSAFDCGQLDVPLDWSNPATGSITLDYIVLSVERHTPRKGTVFLHLAHEYLGRWSHAEHALSALFGGRQNRLEAALPGYDLVMLTPRDSVITQRTRCFLADDEEETFQYSVNPYAHYENATLALYNTTFREDLHREPPWDADMAWLATQGPDDVKDMLQVQEAMLARCRDTSPDRDLFKYGGTAASVRDLVALAAVLDGPGSSVNLWKKHYGSVLASHLLKMFPERVGKIIMDDPVDPIAYQEDLAHKRWSRDLAAANNTLALIQQHHMRNGSTGFMEFFGRPDADDLRFGEIVRFLHLELLEWHTRTEAEYQQVLQQKQIDMWMDANDKEFAVLTMGGTRHSSGVNGWRSSGDAWTMRPLGGMPLVCGDALHEPGADLNAIRAEVEASLVGSMHGAPLIATSAFPPLRYLCDIWPVRAVERVPLRGAYDVALHDKVLILLHEKDFWHYFSVDEDLARELWPASTIVSGLHYGDLVLDHDHSSLDAVKTFFDTGKTLPDEV